MDAEWSWSRASLLVVVESCAQEALGGVEERSGEAHRVNFLVAALRHPGFVALEDDRVGAGEQQR